MRHVIGYLGSIFLKQTFKYLLVSILISHLYSFVLSTDFILELPRIPSILSPLWGSPLCIVLSSIAPRNFLQFLLCPKPQFWLIFLLFIYKIFILLTIFKVFFFFLSPFPTPFSLFLPVRARGSKCHFQLAILKLTFWYVK